MKIVLTGGGTHGHFYPLIAIAEEINTISDERKLLSPSLYYISTEPFDKELLFNNNITFKKSYAGKLRLYFSLWIIPDMFKMAIGIIKAVWDLFLMFPDVVISKGGYASVPTVFAARLLRIPIIIHESDSVPGRVNKWAAKFARKIAVSWREAATFFPEGKTAVTGQPIMREVTTPIDHGAYEYLKLDETTPVILILGGSQGAEKINTVIRAMLPELVSRYQVIHQVGLKNIEAIKKTSQVVLEKSEHKDRYKPFGYLNTLALRMSAGVASIAISRSGSTIFEIASWGMPSIMIPITKSQGDHQRKNAYNYARSGACIVVEEQNLTAGLLLTEIDRIITNKEIYNRMSESAHKFYIPGASATIAKEAIAIALSHEK